MWRHLITEQRLFAVAEHQFALSPLFVQSVLCAG